MHRPSSYARPRSAAPCWLRALACVGFALLFLFLAAQGLRSIHLQFPDFEYFYKAGRWLLDNGGLDRGVDRLTDGRIIQRGSIEWYLPFVTRLMTCVAWLPFEHAGYVWLTLNLLAAISIVRMTGRHLVSQPPRDWPISQFGPFFVLIVFWAWEFRLNQIDTLTLWLLLSSFVLYQRKRLWLSGFWLGLAALVKLTPLLVVLWFAQKREWRVLCVALLTALLAGPVSDGIVFGPRVALEVHRAWFRQALQSSHRGLILDQREMDWRNQGMGAVASRWLHDTNWNTRFDNDPRAPDRREVRTLNVANLPRPIVAWLVSGIAAISLLALLWIARRPARRMSAWALRLEWALFVLAMLWFMPVMRRYHLIWMFPAISLLGAAVHFIGPTRRWSWLTCGVFALVGAAQIALLLKTFTQDNIVEATGVFLAVVPLVAAALIGLLFMLGRDSRLLPDDGPLAEGSPAEAAPGATAAHGASVAPQAVLVDRG